MGWIVFSAMPLENEHSLKYSSLVKDFEWLARQDFERIALLLSHRSQSQYACPGDSRSRDPARLLDFDKQPNRGLSTTPLFFTRHSSAF